MIKLNLKNKKGFTIVELVIVIAVIAILAAILIPTFSNVVEKANLSSDQQAARNAYVAYVADQDGDKIGPATSATYKYVGKNFVITIEDEAVNTTEKVKLADGSFSKVEAEKDLTVTNDVWYKVADGLYAKIDVTTAAVLWQSSESSETGYVENGIKTHAVWDFAD